MFRKIFETDWGSTITIEQQSPPPSPLRSRLDSLVSAFPLAIIGLGRDCRVAEWNEAATRMFGWTSLEVIGHPAPGVPEEERVRFEADLAKAFLPSTSSGFSINETRRLTKSGEVLDLALWTSPLRARDGLTTGVLLVASDISDRKRVEAVLQHAFRDAEEGRALLDTIISEAPVGIALLDRDYRFVRVNSTLAQINGHSVDSHTNSYGGDIVPEIWANIEPALKAILDGAKEKVSLQFSGQTAAAPGITRTWIDSFYPVRVASGDVIGVGMICEEITLQKRATVLVDGQKLALELMVQGAPLGEVLGVLTSIVEEQSSGRCIASILLVEDGKRLRHGAAPNLPDEYNEAMDGVQIGPTVGTCGRAASTGKTVITPDISADPNWAEYQQYATPIGLKAVWSMPIFSRTGEVLGVFGTYFRECRVPTPDELRAVEILARTASVAIERKRAEEALRESEQRFRVMADNSPVIIWVTDPAGEVTYLNTLWHRFTGQLPQISSGHGWAEVVHPEDVASIYDIFRAAIPQKEHITHEYRLRRHDGEYRWMLDTAHPRFAESGEFMGYIGSVIDITDRKVMEEELRAAADRLQVANAAKDEFLGLVSHELRTPITVILGQIDLLSRKPEFFDDETKKEMVSDIHRESLRLYQIIENLLALSRLEQGQQAELEPVIIDRLLVRIVDSFRKTNPGREFIVETAGVPLATGSNLYIEQIVRNLISNATKYSPQDQPIAIVAKAQGDRVLISVRDRGPGIPLKEQERVFSPFYRSDDANFFAQGFGIGLAVCRRLASVMNASIWMENAFDGGSKFSLSLEQAAE